MKMLPHIFYAAVLAVSAAMVECAPRPSRSLPNCAAAPADCTCPSGTTLQSYTTFALIGASAKDVKAVTGSFFQISWLGLSPESTSGPDNKAGSTRTLTVPTNFGTYTFVEKLVSYKEDNDGSFTLLFEQGNGPIPYRNATGSFSGYWDTLSVKYAAAHESFIYLSNYLCATGVVDDFNGFHEFAIKNATSILQSRGQLTGHSAPPVSF